LIPKETINILVTLDEAYIPYLNVMLTSLLRSNPSCRFDVYLLHTAIRQEALGRTEKLLGRAGRLIPIQAEDVGLENAPPPTAIPERSTTASLPPNICRIHWTGCCIWTQT